MRPRILFADIETLPLKTLAWQLKNYGYTPVNMITEDWRICSFAAKWAGSSKVHQFDLRRGITDKNEKKLLRQAWEFLNDADIVITQNGKKFDVPRLLGRMLFYGIKPFSSFEQIDTLKESRKHLSLPSYSLEYVTSRFCKKYKKLTHKQFPGIELWVACMNGVKAAWKEMAKYNIHDVFALEEWFNVLAPYINLNFNKYRGIKGAKCSCGSTEFSKNGYSYRGDGKFQRFACKHCRSELRLSKNLNTSPYRRVTR
jgi:DNA polymerase elongation subunit (family B)